MEPMLELLHHIHLCNVALLDPPVQQVLGGIGGRVELTRAHVRTIWIHAEVRGLEWPRHPRINLLLNHLLLHRHEVIPLQSLILLALLLSNDTIWIEKL